MVRCPTHIAGNKFDLVMTDVTDVVDVFVGNPLGTSDDCIVSCVLRVEQSVPKYNIRCTVLLKHRTNWDNVHSAVRRFTWSTILKSADTIDAFDRAIGEVIGRFVHTTGFHSRSGGKQWFDASWRRAYDAIYHAWCRVCSADDWGQFELDCAVAQGVYGAARESLWCETLQGSIFGVKPFIPALRGPGGGLVVAPAEKASLLGSQFDSKQCSEQSFTHLLVSLIPDAIL